MIDYYCSSTGTGDGLTLSTPGNFATTKALVRANVGTNNITVWVGDGTYTFTETEFFTELDGSSSHIVIWRALPGAAPIFSGGAVITGWTADVKAGVYKATVPAGSQFRHLYVAGQKATRSYRSLSGFSGYDDDTQDFWYEDASGFNWTTITRPQDLEGWFQLYRWSIGMMRMSGGITSMGGGVYRIFGYPHKYEYEAEAALIAAWGYVLPDPTYEMNAYWLVRDGGWIGFGYPESSNAFTGDFLRIENAYEFLNSTTKGHWYLNIDTSTLYYVPRDGEDINTVEVIAPQVENIFNFNGTQNVFFVGIKFKHADWFAGNHYNTLLDHGDAVFANPQYLHYDTDLNASYLVGIKGAVEVNYSTNVKFIQCPIENCGGIGFDLQKGNHQCEVLGGYYQKIAGHAIRNKDFLVYYVQDKETSGITLSVGWEWQEINITEADRNIGTKILSNKVTEVADTYTGEAGITVGSAEQTIMDHNETWNLPYHGISCRANFGRYEYPYNHRIRKNLVHDIMQKWSDGGGIYCAGGQLGALVEENFIYNSSKATSAQAMAWPIYLDDMSTGLVARKNVVLKNISGGPKEWTLMKNWAVPATGNPNWPFPEPTRDLHLNYPNQMVDNYFEMGMLANITTENPNRIVSGNTSISADPASWPAEVIRIKKESGVELLLTTDLIGDEVIIFGWLDSAEESVDLTASTGTIEDYEEFSNLGWRARVTGVVDGVVVSAAIAGKSSSITVGTLPSVISGAGNIPIVFKGLGGVIIPINYKQ